MEMRRAVFLDRDGVLNRAVVREGKPYPPAGLAEVEILPGVLDALTALRAAGFMLIVVTNQPDVARGTTPRTVVEEINTYLVDHLPIDEFRTCYHDIGDGCDCRKPLPGLLVAAAKQHRIDLENSYMVGDRWRDTEAGRRAGCKTIFIDYNYDETKPEAVEYRVTSLLEAAQIILKGGQMKKIEDLKIQIFADGADKAGMLEMYARPYIQGFTTNPTLMRKAGVSDYRGFAKDIVEAIPDRPISFEVFSDEFAEMERQALEMASWGKHVYVKIPITNTRRVPSYDLIRKLSHASVKVNVTALMTLAQVRNVVECIAGGAPCYVSIFAGRVADTGLDPVPLMAAAVELLRVTPNAELIWASPRELLNIFQADGIGCHIITVTNDILKRLSLVNYDLDEFSLDTVKMFYNDAIAAGFKL